MAAGICRRKWFWVAVLWVDLLGSRLSTSKASEWDNAFEIEDHDAYLQVPELIRKYGYPVETHQVQSLDGYVLSLTRIPPKNRQASKPVLLVHGLLASSADYVVIGPNNALAYLLADKGYDVWIADMRGNRYSRKHVSLSPKSKEFWDFSWHEMGYYDLPAVIDYILQHSENARKLFYVGHSQGTTVFFVMASARPEYNKKIELMVALSPAVFLSRYKGQTMRLLVRYADFLREMYEALNLYQVLPYSKYQYEVAKTLCPADEEQNVCMDFIGTLVGPNPTKLDPRALLVYMGHNSAGASLKQLTHYVQIIRSGKFRRYDHGRKGNLATYSHWKPPSYNLSAVTAPVVIYYAQNDYIVDPRDVMEFSRRLPNLVAMNAVDDAHFNHFDFVIAKNVRPMVYDKLISDLEGKKKRKK